MTKKEALELIGKKKGWLAIEDCGKYSEYYFSSARPLTTEAYKIGTQEENEKAAEVLEMLNFRGCETDVIIGKIAIKNGGKIRLTNSGNSEEALVKFLDAHHFEMSNSKGEFDAIGSHVWGNTEFEDFCHRYGTTIEAI